MKDKIEHHPDVTRFAMENLELRGNDKITSRAFHIKIVPTRRRCFRSLVFNSVYSGCVKYVFGVMVLQCACNQILTVFYSL